MKTLRKHARAAMLLVIGIALSFIALHAGEFSYYSICQSCGKWRTTRVIGVHAWNWSLLTRHEERDTPLSLLLWKDGIGKPHEHVWLFGQGGGNGVKCAIGHGRHLAGNVNDPTLVQFLADARKFGQGQVASNVLAVAMNPKTSYDARHLVSGYPETGFATRGYFLDWMRENESYLEWRNEIIRAGNTGSVVETSAANERP
ncbi:MAG: hypothetical protein FD161_1079 [Limisphaerales bacterium]|nr:MAG: hypothetical protein FD161_1079 [Limisphaerales bacterium]KAG0509862.1 MAG: hypothetical protein E1N63_1079 [Limisphaerales bacterium]TXT50916.1 MAG: hypothetical protein FD140_1978 [Limisphaerales bacterium]